MNVNGFEVDDIKYTDNLGYGNFCGASVASTLWSANYSLSSDV